MSETSFKIELVLFFIMLPCIFILDTSLTQKLLLFMTLMLVLIAETINSAIERVVDLVTLEHHELAGRAKDAGSTIVFLSLTTCGIVWSVILFNIFF